MNVVVVQGYRKGQAVSLDQDLSIGRDGANQLVLSDPRVSRLHARIERVEERYVLEDLASSNGTYVNGKPVARCVLNEGDEILVGSTRLKVLADGASLEMVEEEVKILPEDFPCTQVKHPVDSQRSTYLDLEGRSLKLEQFKKTAKNLSILYRSGSAFSAILDEERLVASLIDLIMEVIAADRYVVMFRDERTAELIPKVIRRAKDQKGFVPIAIPRSIVETVLNEHVGILSTHAGQDDRFKGTESVHIYGIKSAMCVPITAKDRILGLIYCDSLAKIAQFDEDDLKLLTTIAAQGAVALENARLYREVRDQERLKNELLIAREIQQILLPRRFPNLKGFDFAFRSLAAEEVGGDYYDWFWVDPDRLALVVADVSGKGVPGALVMAMFRSTLKSRALGSLSTSWLLREVNNLLIPDMKQDMFISASLVFLDVKRRVLTFSRAGHLPLLIFRHASGTIEEHCPKGMAMGFSMWADLTGIEEETLSLDKGDIAVFYTDGVEEAQSPQHESYGRERFLQLLKSAVGLWGYQKAQVLLQKLLGGIGEFAQDAPQADDITLGLLKME